MTTTIATINNNNTQVSLATGFEIESSYKADSGFNYLEGVRMLDGGLRIMEEVAHGTACTFLCGIRIIAADNKTLIKEIVVGKNQRYTRELVVDIVQEALMETFCEEADMNNQSFNEDVAEERIAEILDKCYFEQSRKAAWSWAESIGVI